MTEARTNFIRWTDVLLNPTSPPLAQREAANAWCDWLMARWGMDPLAIDAPGHAHSVPTRLATGIAISPQRAVLCVREHLRTAVFLRATAAAINAARAQFPGETIHLVEAGCGPAAPIALAMAARHSPEELQVTLLDIHEGSLAAARELAAELGLAASLRGTICGDATMVCFGAGDRPHIVVAEVLRRALKAEPQVAVTRALAPQVRAGGFFLPERIELLFGRWRAPAVDEAGVAPEIVGEAFVLDAATAAAEPQDERGFLPDRALPAPSGDPRGWRLFTQMQVFREHWLRHCDCSLTLPENLRVAPLASSAANGALRFAYEISSDPGLRISAIEAKRGAVGEPSPAP